MATHHPTQTPSPPSVLWLCPHRSFDLSTTHKILSTIPPNSTAPLPPCSPSSCHKNLSTIIETSSTSPPTYTLRTFISLTPTTPLKSLYPRLSKPLIRQLLPHLHIPICAHLNISDDIVAHVYNITPSSPSSQPLISATCSACYASQKHTSIAFTEIPYQNPPSSTPTIAIELVRTLGHLPTPQSHWDAYALPPAQMDLLAVTWEAWVSKHAELFKSWCPGNSANHPMSNPQTAPPGILSPGEAPPPPPPFNFGPRNSIPSVGVTRCARIRHWAARLKVRARGSRLVELGGRAKIVFKGRFRERVVLVRGEKLWGGDGGEGEGEGRGLLQREGEGEGEGRGNEDEGEEGEEDEKMQTEKQKHQQQAQRGQAAASTPAEMAWTATMPGAGMMVW